eukprot:2571483-Rhodomonas_salina.1
MEVVEGGISRVALGKRLCGPDDEEVGAGGVLWRDCRSGDGDEDGSENDPMVAMYTEDRPTRSGARPEGAQRQTRGEVEKRAREMQARVRDQVLMQDKDLNATDSHADAYGKTEHAAVAAQSAQDSKAWRRNEEGLDERSKSQERERRLREDIAAERRAAEAAARWENFKEGSEEATDRQGLSDLERGLQ